VIPPEAFYAGLNKVLAAAAGFITDAAGRVLLVKPNYRDHWGLPGGHIDEDEHPEIACARELQEELGLTLPVGRLLVVQWVPPFDGRPYPLIHFLFDCGSVPDGAEVVLQEEELEEYGYFTAEEIKDRELVPGFLLARITAGARARATGGTFYLGPSAGAPA